MFLKYSILAIASVTVINSCTAQPNTAKIEEPKELKKEVMLLGEQPISAFEQPPYSSWYDTEFSGYKMDDAAVSQLKSKNLNGYLITAFVGTWCEDSHREFPRLIKILKSANFPESNLHIIAVDRSKTAPNGEEVPFNVHKVPTFIIKKDGKELGRITEYPASGFLEKDLAAILNKG